MTCILIVEARTSITVKCSAAGTKDSSSGNAWLHATSTMPPTPSTHTGIWNNSNFSNCSYVAGKVVDLIQPMESISSMLLKRSKGKNRQILIIFLMLKEIAFLMETIK